MPDALQQAGQAVRVKNEPEDTPEVRSRSPILRRSAFRQRTPSPKRSTGSTSVSSSSGIHLAKRIAIIGGEPADRTRVKVEVKQEDYSGAVPTTPGLPPYAVRTAVRTVLSFCKHDTKK